MLARHLALAATLVAAAQCVPHEDTRTPEPTATKAKPRLVVLLVIDQLPSWTFDAQHSQLDGGIARLLAHGVYWPHARYPYAASHTAPGHATIATGAPPSVHGIVANRWIDPETGELHEVDDDASVTVLDPRGGPGHAHGISNAKLMVDGLADALHAGHGRSAHAIAIGLKGRAAGHVIGRRPDLALWFDSGFGALTSSTAFVDALPEWVTAFAAAHPRDTLLAQTWRADDAERLAKLAGGPDDRPGEGDPYGLGHTYPHDLARASDPAKAFAFTPMANTLLVDAAIAALEAGHLGNDDVPDLLAVTFSAHDYAGHVWCQESWERVDHLLQIDRDVGRLLDTLDREVGRDRWAVVLTSDHGSTPSLALAAPEDRRRLVLAEHVDAVANEAAQRVLGAGKWIAGTSVAGVTTTPTFDALPAERRDVALAAMTAAIADMPGIGLVARADALLGDCDERTGDDALACRSAYAGRNPTLFTFAASGSLLNDDRRECTAHGSPNLYDREVPLVVMAPGLAAAQRNDEVSMLQVAPTITTLLGVPPPPAAKLPSLLP